MGIELNQYRASIGYFLKVYVWTKSVDWSNVDLETLHSLFSWCIFFLQIIVMSIFLVFFSSLYQIYNADRQSNSYVSAQDSFTVLKNIWPVSAKNSAIYTSGQSCSICMKQLEMIDVFVSTLFSMVSNFQSKYEYGYRFSRHFCAA